jgi:hypothetical protein
VTVLSMLGLGACTTTLRAPDPAAPSRLMNRVWLVARPAGRAPGSFYVFLADGTLLMSSCVETYRLATWRAAGGDRLVVTEEPAVSYGVRVLAVGERDARLRLELVSETVDLELRAATAPFVCPDLPR